MSGVAILHAALSQSVGVTDFVGDWIVGGLLPQNAGYPAISVMSVSTMGERYLAKQKTHFVSERVQVTAVARKYAEVKAMMPLIHGSCDFGQVVLAPYSNISIACLGDGPDLVDAVLGLKQQSVDYRVGYNLPA